MDMDCSPAIDSSLASMSPSLSISILLYHAVSCSRRTHARHVHMSDGENKSWILLNLQRMNGRDTVRILQNFK